MPDLRLLSDQELIDTSHHLRRVALSGSSIALAEARRHEAELRARFLEVDHLTSSFSEPQAKAQPSLELEPMLLAAAAETYIIATADTATRSGQALRDLLHNLRVLLKMDIAFVAELVDGKKIYRELDRAEDSTVSVQPSASAPLETTLCQRVVDGRAPEVVQDVQSHPHLTELAAVRAMNIGAYISTPVILRNGTVYGTLCCISHTPRSALGSRQVDSLRYVAGIVAAELEKRRE
jgi:GAF domain-containing protein